MESLSSDDRTTAHLIEILDLDCQRCLDGLNTSLDAGKVNSDGSVDADYEYHARQYFRAVFAYIEALIFSVKVRAIAHFILNKVDFLEAERLLATDTGYKLADNGTVKEERAHIKLSDNIRFAISLTERAKNIPQKFDPATSEWWSCLKSSIRVRDRLMHPKMPADIDISGDEITTLFTAFEGFRDLFANYPPYPAIGPNDVNDINRL